ncbi:MAG TPA: hypothetical protein VH022_14355 [Candidatus Acidoferrum sp.]|jgi:hypothetical protein|nr:hypothetical protein [Candidatus Acidoferrum sp.]
MSETLMSRFVVINDDENSIYPYQVFDQKEERIIGRTSNAESAYLWANQLNAEGLPRGE